MTERISLLSDERIAFYRGLKGEHPRLKERGVILIEGEEQIRRAKLCGVRFFEAFFEDGAANSELLAGVPTVFVASRKLMEEIVGYRLHRGYFALAERPCMVSLPEAPLPAIALNGMSDPENVGNISRTAVAFGFRSVIFDRESSDPLSRRAIRVSMGAVFATSVVAVESLEALSELPAIRIAVECDGEPLSEKSFPEDKRFVLIFGNEKRGISPVVIRKAHQVVRVEMEKTLLSSLNVSAAAAIVCSRAYEKRRGKRERGSEE